MTPVTPGTPVFPDASGIPCADGSASHRAVQTESRRHRRLFARSKGLALLASLCLLSGCGGGLALTGGSIPPGGSRLIGRVAWAEDPSKALPNATVQVETRPVTGGVRTLTAITASDGSFTFTNVPTGSTTSTFTVTVTPPVEPDPNLARQPQRIVFQAEKGIADDLAVSLPLTTAATAAKLTLSPITTVQEGQTAVLHARLFDSGGARLSLEPTLLYAGNFGKIQTDATFLSAKPGTGTVSAFWYNLSSVTTSIRVAPADSGLPPPPPIQPDVPPFIRTLPKGPL